MSQLTPAERRVAVAAGRVIIEDMRKAADGVDDSAVKASEALTSFAAALERELNAIDEALS